MGNWISLSNRTNFGSVFLYGENVMRALTPSLFV